MAFASHCPMGKIVWKASYSKIAICFVTYYFGINQ